MAEIRHVRLNPSEVFIGESPMERACARMEALGFALVRIVPYTQYEATAVFEREQLVLRETARQEVVRNLSGGAHIDGRDDSYDGGGDVCS